MPRVITFQDRFAPLVVSWAKRHTMRLECSTTPKPGDVRSLRKWSGLPYRSKQIVLIPEVIIRKVEPILISWPKPRQHRNLRIVMGNLLLDHEQMRAFAIADGFRDLKDMIEWLDKNRSLPFKAVLIHW